MPPESNSQISEIAVIELDKMFNKIPCKKGKPVLRWNSRMRTSAGRYKVREHAIELNPHLISDKERLLEILRHEYAHAAACEQAPKETHHGDTWRQIALQLGSNGKSTHRYDVSELKRTARYLKEYECPACKLHWHVARKYKKNVYHICPQNTQRKKVKFIGIVDTQAEIIKQKPERQKPESIKKKMQQIEPTAQLVLELF